MKILITGVRSFFGGNLAAALADFRDGRDCIHNINGEKWKICVWDSDLPWEELDRYCRDADFVFHFAGTDVSDNPDEFMRGNFGLSMKLLDKLRRYQNTCPVMLASSVWAARAEKRAGSCSGRYLEYGRSKLAAEELLFEHEARTGAKALIYRFPDFSDEQKGTAKAVYEEALVEEMTAALRGQEHRCEFYGNRAGARRNGRYCFVPLADNSAEHNSFLQGQVAEERDKWLKNGGNYKV